MTTIKLRMLSPNSNWQKELETSVKFFAKRLYDMQFADISLNAKKKAIDVDYRIITDLISCESSHVSHHTPYIIRNCKWWSKKAIEIFNNTEGSFADKCNVKINGKRAYSVEHEYPVGIIKNMIVKKLFKTEKEVYNHIKKYGRVIIVSHEENYQLSWKQKTANTIEEAHNRYNQIGIEVVNVSALELFDDCEINRLSDNLGLFLDRLESDALTLIQ